MGLRVIGPALGVALALTLLGCGDDAAGDRGEAGVTTASSLGVRDEDEAADVLSMLGTGLERLIYEASTGDENARTELLGRCHDALRKLRQAGNGRLKDTNHICARIRDSTEGTAWDDLRREVKEVTGGR